MKTIKLTKWCFYQSSTLLYLVYAEESSTKVLLCSYENKRSQPENPGLASYLLNQMPGCLPTLTFKSEFAS